jgi:malonyl-CoA/methylmalonyl-CoA synthetase
VSLCYRACHWILGTINLLRPILTGNKLHVLEENASAEALLGAMTRHRFTHVVFTPTLLRQMKDLVLSGGDGVEHVATAFQGLRAIACTAAPIEPSLREFWTGLTGLPFENFYGATETGGAICRRVSGPNVSPAFLMVNKAVAHCVSP